MTTLPDVLAQAKSLQQPQPSLESAWVVCGKTSRLPDLELATKSSRVLAPKNEKCRTHPVHLHSKKQRNPTLYLSCRPTYLQTIMSCYWDWLSPDLQRIILAHHGCGPVNTDFCSHPASRCQVTHVDLLTTNQLQIWGLPS